MIDERAILLAFISVTLLASTASTFAQSKPVTVVRAGTLIDTQEGRALPNQIIVIEGDRITAVGAGLAIPKDATVLDLSRAVVLPGLIDAHVHITGESTGNYLDNLFRKSFVDSAVLAHLYARRTLEAGFTVPERWAPSASPTSRCAMPSIAATSRGRAFRSRPITSPRPAVTATSSASRPGSRTARPRR